MTAPPPRRSLRFHWIALSVAVLASAALTLVFRSATERLPARGYTALGLALGISVAAFFLAATVYTYRKRAGQEHLPGRLQTWLRLHAWLSLGAFWAVLLHSGFHLDGGTGTWALLLLGATLVSGIGGWIVYAKVPAAVHDRVQNLATRGTEARMRELRAEIEDAAAGRTDTFKARVARLLDASSPQPVGAIAPDEARLFERVQSLVSEMRAEEARLSSQKRLHGYLRGWLWVHVPVAILFLLALVTHAYDATEGKWRLATAGPKDFASPETCARCHPLQYEEWIASEHAVAQSSPVMDLQNRLVLAKEGADLASRRLAAPIVGDLCVKCHAPTGYLGKPEDHEDPLMTIRDRSPASQYGISCVSCHQVTAIHRGSPESDPDGLAFKNIENLEWTRGRVMLGSFGREGDSALPSIGNDTHRGEYRAHFGSSDFCASCHTVTVDIPGTHQRIVKLQDTYSEWLEGGKEFDWRAHGVGCMACHNMDLTSVAALARRMEHERVDLRSRLGRIHDALGGLRLEGASALAAAPRDGFDLPLPPRRRFLHTYTGVDARLEDGVPHLPGHAQHSENGRIAADANHRTADLLRIATAVRIDGWPPDGNLAVSVMNLGTGHHMPAGFAFARETWLEISTAAAGSEDWHVVTGGRGGRPIESAEPLDKTDARLRNFQAVLFDGEAGKETVLQNETTAVLTGQAAVAKGFVDREKYLLPGEIRPIKIPLAKGASPWDETRTAGRVRVRCYSGSLPPEFLEGLARRFDVLHDSTNAARARALAARLPIHVMAEDVIENP